MSFKPTNNLHKVDLALNVDYTQPETKARKLKLGAKPVTDRSQSVYSRDNFSFEGSDAQKFSQLQLLDHFQRKLSQFQQDSKLIDQIKRAPRLDNEVDYNDIFQGKDSQR